MKGKEKKSARARKRQEKNEAHAEMHKKPEELKSKAVRSVSRRRHWPSHSSSELSRLWWFLHFPAFLFLYQLVRFSFTVQELFEAEIEKHSLFFDSLQTFLFCAVFQSLCPSFWFRWVLLSWLLIVCLDCSGSDTDNQALKMLRLRVQILAPYQSVPLIFDSYALLTESLFEMQQLYSRICASAL